MYFDPEDVSHVDLDEDEEEENQMSMEIRVGDSRAAAAASRYTKAPALDDEQEFHGGIVQVSIPPSSPCLHL